MIEITASEIHTIRQEFLSMPLQSFIDCAAHFNNQGASLNEYITDQSEKIALWRNRFPEKPVLTDAEESLWSQLVKQSDQAVIA